jgi:uncharacterized protein (UPF0276 family)
VTAGVGFKPEYMDDALSCTAAGMWFEIHAENYMIGGPRLRMLLALRERFPLSVHGVGLSLAADADPNPEHLQRLKQVVLRTEPFVVSEHLAWAAYDGVWQPDLLPFPRTQASLDRVVRNVSITQEVLQRRILIENPSMYVSLEHEIPEAEFLAELVKRSGCGLLVDVNNAYVSAHNIGGDAASYLASLPQEAVGEIHLAGHAPDEGGSALLIDTHGAPVCDAVWQLYAEFIARIGARPTLIERDDHLPAFDELFGEREQAAALMSIHASALMERRHALAG